MKFNREKCWVLGRLRPWKWHNLAMAQAGNGPAGEKHCVGGLGASHGQWADQAPEQQGPAAFWAVWAWAKPGVWGVSLSFTTQHLLGHVEMLQWVWVPLYRNNVDKLEGVQQRAIKRDGHYSTGPVMRGCRTSVSSAWKKNGLEDT